MLYKDPQNQNCRAVLHVLSVLFPILKSFRKLKLSITERYKELDLPGVWGRKSLTEMGLSDSKTERIPLLTINTDNFIREKRDINLLHVACFFLETKEIFR